MAVLRCFIGLPLPGEAMRALTREAARLSRALSARIGWTRPENWHVTLRFLGDVDEAALPALLGALSGVRFAAFEMRLGAAGSFPPCRAGGRCAPRVLWVGLERGGGECVALAADIEKALGPLGFAPEDRPPHPHVTLGRVRQPAAGGEGPGDDWAGALASVDLSALPPFPAERFTLWRSTLGPGGPSYAPLAEYPAS